MNIRSTLQTLFIVAALLLVGVMVVQEVREATDESLRTVHLAFMAAGNRPQKDAYLQLCREFEAAHPGIRVRLEWIGAGDYFGMLLTRIAGRVAPDVAWFNDPLVPNYADKGALLDLTPFVQRDLDSDLRDFHDLSLVAFTHQDGLYGLPLSYAVWVLAYNKAHFDEEGIAYPDDTWTWEDLRDAALRLTRRDESGRTLRFGLAAIPHYEMIDMVTRRRFLGAGLESLHFADAENVASATFFHDLSLIDRVAPGLGEREEQSTTGLFQSGRASMNFIGRWMVPEFNLVESLDYDVAPVPMWRNGHRATLTRVVGICIPSDTPHPEEAWKLVRFLTGQRVSEVMAEIDSVPARRSVLHSPSFLRPETRPASDDVFIDALSYAQLAQITDPPLPPMLKSTSEGILAGLYTAEEGMLRLSRETERFISRKGARILRE